MQPKRNRSRKSAIIRNSRWLSYATAGAATAIAGTHAAEGTIHYSGPINQKIRRNMQAPFQLDQFGDFISLGDRTGTAYRGYPYFGVTALAGASIVGYYGLRAFVSNLDRGQLVSMAPFIPARSANIVTDPGGQFQGRGVGYIGFKFNNGSGDQYGWVRIETLHTWSGRFLLRDFAYGDVGDQIRAGQKSSNEMVPDQGSLGWLALGATGLLAWRKTRSRVGS